MRIYWVIIQITEQSFEVSCPDIKNAITFAPTLEEAIIMADDVIKEVLKDEPFWPEASKYDDVKLFSNSTEYQSIVIPILVPGK